MAKKVKKRLSQQQEFDIMKLVLDKFLWIGFLIMGYGLVLLLVQGMDAILSALSAFIIGAVILLLFMILIVKEYEIVK